MANDTDKKMMFGQQCCALVSNVRGNARLRIDSFTRRVPIELSREDFKKVIDTFLCWIDPVDRAVLAHIFSAMLGIHGNARSR